MDREKGRECRAALMPEERRLSWCFRALIHRPVRFEYDTGCGPAGEWRRSWIKGDGPGIHEIGSEAAGLRLPLDFHG